MEGRSTRNQDAMVDQVDKSVILATHAIHKVSWHRWIDVLSAIEKNNGAKIADIRALLKQEMILEIFLNDASVKLFGTVRRGEEIGKLVAVKLCCVVRAEE